MKKPTTPSSVPLSGLFAGVFALGLGSAVAFAQSTPNQTVPGETQQRGQNVNVNNDRDGSLKRDNMGRELSRGDRRFFQKATSLGEKEVALSRIAERRAINPQVREFAAQMVREHTAANAKLADLAAKKGAAWEREDETEMRRQENKWNEKSGNDFDEDYLEAMIDAHEDTVDVLEKGADSKDPEIAAYARELLPAVKAHLKKAEWLEDSID
jgi:putative membrane protein